LTLIGCHEKKHEFTRKVPNSSLYEELFTANSFGLYASYLTDSASFRTYIGEVDLEHDYFKYNINKERIHIQKIKTGDKNCRWVTTEDGRQTILCDTEVIDIKSLDLNKLKRDGKFD
jgi:hypothetical protein